VWPVWVLASGGRWTLQRAIEVQDFGPHQVSGRGAPPALRLLPEEWVLVRQGRHDQSWSSDFF
jgi:hypothetical protein